MKIDVEKINALRDEVVDLYCDGDEDLALKLCMDEFIMGGGHSIYSRPIICVLIDELIKLQKQCEEVAI